MSHSVDSISIPRTGGRGRKKVRTYTRKLLRRAKRKSK